ncbi:MAG: ABC transporter permease [Candidatus Verstraetearchaeota archaeon]|nr:ABC transporter permease [Candidatus Verstraetearchaeota archaeon]
MLRKHRNLLDYSFDCLRRYRMRTAVILVTFLVATTMISAVLFAKEGLEREAEFSVEAAPDLTVQYLKGGRVEPINTSYIDIIAGIPGVEKVLKRTWGYAGIGAYTFVVVGLDPEGLDHSRGVITSLEEGRFLKPEDEGTGNIVIGKLIAYMLKVKVGDDIILLSESVEANKFHVVGVFSDSSSIYTADLILMSFSDANKFFSMPEGMVTDLCVYVDPAEDPASVASKMNSVSNIRVLDQDLLLRGYKAAYGARGGIFTTLWTILLVAIAMIAFSQAIVVGHESKFEVGLLKTFGFSTLDIIEVRLVESLVLGFFAASLGMLIGYFYTAFFNAPGLVDILLGWAYLPREFRLPVYVSLQSVFSIYAVTVIPLLITTVVPAWLNAITDPELAMRRAAA